jgi:hypothetical protein
MCEEVQVPLVSLLLLFCLHCISNAAEFLFMFQDDNVRNQRENVTLTLANAQSRLSLPNETEPVSSPPFLIWIHLNKKTFGHLGCGVQLDPYLC